VATASKDRQRNRVRRPSRAANPRVRESRDTGQRCDGDAVRPRLACQGSNREETASHRRRGGSREESAAHHRLSPASSRRQRQAIRRTGSSRSRLRHTVGSAGDHRPSLNSTQRPLFPSSLSSSCLTNTMTNARGATTKHVTTTNILSGAYPTYRRASSPTATATPPIEMKKSE
jgi:hypothetical protein